MLRILAVGLIFYVAVNGRLPDGDILGMAPEAVVSVIIALLLAPTVGRMME